MATRVVVVGITGGVHARPAAEIARLATEHRRPVTVTTASGDSVELSSVLALMDLSISHGDRITLHADGPDATALLDTLSALFDPS